MRLFLIRHGETVDNVAGLYAGSRDSPLTQHGVAQARRLAAHLAQTVELKYIFSSDLQRAARTADAVCDAQICAHLTDIPVMRLPDLREKDFGMAEGLKYGSSRAEETMRMRDDAETLESMKARVDRFLDKHLMPLLRVPSHPNSGCAVVAHGIILGVLFRALWARMPRAAVTVAIEAQRAGLSVANMLPVLPPWSNTAYLEAVVSITAVSFPPSASRPGSPRVLRLHIKNANCVAHLRDLKKTGGGIGSTKHDDKQRTMDSFFNAASKKRKVDDLV